MDIQEDDEVEILVRGQVRSHFSGDVSISTGNQPSFSQVQFHRRDIESGHVEIMSIRRPTKFRAGDIVAIPDDSRSFIRVTGGFRNPAEPDHLAEDGSIRATGLENFGQVVAHGALASRSTHDSI